MDWAFLIALGMGYALGSLVTLDLFDRGDDDDPIVSDPLPEPVDPLPEPDDPLQGTAGVDLITGDVSNDGYRIEIFGRAGDDTIDVNAVDGDLLIDGGAGDDTIAAQTLIGPFTQIFGGNGDDDIDVRDIENGQTFGGAGDDTIRLNGFNSGGAGYVQGISGDGGDDTLIWEDSALPADQGGEPQTIFGGAGKDTFDITFDEGAAFDAGDNRTAHTVALGDFDPEEDKLIITPDIGDEDYTVTTAFLTENADTTDLTVRYERDGSEVDVVMTINGKGLTWDDIQFEGPNQPIVLIPV